MSPVNFTVILLASFALKTLIKILSWLIYYIYYTWKTIKSTYNKNKFKRSASTLNDEFHLPDGSRSESDN